MGDTRGILTPDPDGAIGVGETAAHTGGFILWSAGNDETFGPVELGPDYTPKQLRECDDVTNFNR